MIVNCQNVGKMQPLKLRGEVGMFSFFVVSLVSALYFYVDAFKSGLPPKRWAFGGLIIGPLLLPMFNISKHIAWRKAVGFGSVSISA